MDDLTQKLLLALLAFLLGLLAEAIKRVFQRERRRLSYSVVKEPLIAVTHDLPEKVRQRVPPQGQFNVTRFRIVGQNTGSTSLAGLSLLVVANEDAEVLSHSVATVPPRGVKHGSITQPKANELSVEQIELDRKQSIEAELYVKSERAPEITTYWSGGGGVDWIGGGSPSALRTEEHLVAIIRNYILAEFVPSLFTGVGYLLGSLLSGLTGELISSNVATMGGLGVGTTIGALLRFYFYLKMVPHAVALLREFTERRSATARGSSIQTAV